MQKEKDGKEDVCAVFAVAAHLSSLPLLAPTSQTTDWPLPLPTSLDLTNAKAPLGTSSNSHADVAHLLLAGDFRGSCCS